MEQGKPPPPHISPTGMWVSKLALRFIQFALAIAIIGCAGSILSSGVWRSITFIVITPQAIVSAIWSLAEGICIIARAGHRGIHPGANVALDLLLWLGLVAGTVLLWLTGVVAARVASSDWPDSYNVDIVYDGYDIGGGDIASVVRMWEALIGLGAALTYVFTALHFVSVTGWYSKLTWCGFIGSFTSRPSLLRALRLASGTVGTTWLL
ncbi:hypothetical protein B0I37DRAFT_381868 [Chaetomium sp. MPI-CAGE-AT-0009]|nr:hypothetical protein B0I37DRAFT_381868 [Chaetomium sp. MPI-CAGE-AT-0009]